jgi:hypothetical protein
VGFGQGRKVTTKGARVSSVRCQVLLFHMSVLSLLPLEITHLNLFSYTMRTDLLRGALIHEGREIGLNFFSK